MCVHICFSAGFFHGSCQNVENSYFDTVRQEEKHGKVLPFSLGSIDCSHIGKIQKIIFFSVY